MTADLASVCACGGCGEAPATYAGLDVRRVPVRPTWLGRESSRRRARGGRSLPGPVGRAVGFAHLRVDDSIAALHQATAEALLGDVAALWTTAPPFSTAGIGAHHAGPVPWVADLRDPGRRNLAASGLDNVLVRARRVGVRSRLRRADAVVAANEATARADSGWLGRPIEVIETGFDPVHDVDHAPGSQGPGLHLVLAGKVYPGLHQPEAVLAAAAAAGPDVRFTYCGRDGAALAHHARAAGIGAGFTDRGFLPPAEMPEILAAADVLVLPTTVRGDKGLPGGKLMDYLGARRPILAGPGADPPVDAMLRSVGAGAVVTSTSAMAAMLRTWADEKAATGTVRWRGDVERLHRFRSDQTAGRLAAVLDRVAR